MVKLALIENIKVRFGNTLFMLSGKVSNRVHLPNASDDDRVLLAFFKFRGLWSDEIRIGTQVKGMAPN